MQYYHNSDELYHYGVKGMKWGVRRARKKYADKAQRQADAHFDNARVLRGARKTGIGDHGLKLDIGEMKAYSHEMRRSIESGKAWLKARNDILAMNSSTITSKDIKKRFKDTMSKDGAGYYPFA